MALSRVLLVEAVSEVFDRIATVAMMGARSI
jgi:hypothetical protein